MFTPHIKEHIISSKKGGQLKALAAEIGISQTHLWRISNLPSDPKLSTALAIADALGKDVRELFAPRHLGTNTKIRKFDAIVKTENKGDLA